MGSRIPFHARFKDDVDAKKGWIDVNWMREIGMKISNRYEAIQKAMLVGHSLPSH